MLKKILKIIASISFVMFIILVLGASIRGVYGNPDMSTLGTSYYKDEGPLELSPEKGRFALTYSLVENKSGHFSLEIAKIVTPDLGYKDGKFVSLFAPAVSFIVIPGYLIGKIFGASQVGSYAVISFFALLNVVLIYLISKRLKATSIASAIAGILFLSATPAFAYAITLYQHHITVFFLLSSIYILLRWKGMWPLFAIWALVVGSVIIDYPNFFMFFPIGLFSLSRIINVKKVNKSVSLKIKLAGFFTLISITIPIILFAYTNNISYGNPIQLAGTLRTVKDIDSGGNPLFWEDIEIRENRKPTKIDSTEKKTALGFFETRNVLNGLYTHLVSSERGIIWYTPVILFGIAGIFILYKRIPKTTALLVSVIGINVLLYSMWGDPWGGWAFGSRYLIPSYSLLAIFTALAITRFSKNAFLLLVFFIFLSYSVGVNTLGALTTNRIPPKGEVLELERLSGREEKYTYKRNWDFLISNNSKSFFYQTVAKNYLTAKDYYFTVSGLITFIMGSQIILMYIISRKEKH